MNQDQSVNNQLCAEIKDPFRGGICQIVSRYCLVNANMDRDPATLNLPIVFSFILNGHHSEKNIF